MDKKIVVLIVVIAIIVIGFLATYVSNTQNIPVAKFRDAIITSPNFIVGIPEIKAGQSATLTVNVENISNKTIDNVVIKTHPKISKNGEYISIQKETPLGIPIGGGGSSGPISIPIIGIKAPTVQATENIVVELYVKNKLQESKELELKLIQ